MADEAPRDTLDVGPAPAAMEGPVIESWEKRVLRLAREQQVQRASGKRPYAIEYLDEQEDVLDRAYRALSSAAMEETLLSYGGEWLLDNYYIVQHAIRETREGLPRHFYRQLPKLAAEPLAGYPRVYALAREIAATSEAHLDMAALLSFVETYEKVQPLTIGEIWALPMMLRLVIISVLAQAVAEYAGRATKRRSRQLPPIEWPPDLPIDSIVAHCIMSLRMLQAQDWESFFERVSTVEHVLRRDPAQMYARMDFPTRDQYRKVVEEIARRTAVEEADVAQHAVHLAQQATAAQPLPQAEVEERARHVGFYLIGEGRSQLEHLVAYRPRGVIGIQRSVLAYPALYYLGTIALVSVLLLFWLLRYDYLRGGSVSQMLVLASLGLVLAVGIAVSLTNWVFTRVLPTRMLPKLDFSEGIPEDYRTMVVVPVLLSSPEDGIALARQLELHYLSNMDDNISLALLTDFADAPEPHMPEDDEIVAEASRAIQALNQRYPRDVGDPFYLFHRERRWNPCEERWMGWERKRGKLEEFNRLLLGYDDSSYVVRLGDLSVLPTIRYVITLDADTTLPLDAGRRLIATLAHPLNRAEFDPQTGRVTSGYTVLQPRTAVKPLSASQTFLSRISSGDVGLDLYTLAVSDIYQDLFGEGIFVGKGIYEVASFHRSLHNKVPENTLLSHDLFEGSQGRAGLVTDIVLYEDYPSQYLVHTRRTHRWIRGDWQLLPWLWLRVPTADGRMVTNNLSLVSRWKILDNLRRSLAAPALMALFLGGWFWFEGPAWIWTLIGVLVPGSSLVLSLLGDVLNTWRRRLANLPRSSLAMAVLRWLYGLVFLPYEAVIAFDAIGTTLVRLFVTRKRLLEWATHAHTVSLFGHHAQLSIVWEQMWIAPLMAIAIAFVAALARPAILPSAGPLLLLWTASPYVAYAISRRVVHQEAPLEENDIRQLRRLARRTWLYFERFVGPDDNWLAPDHFQEDPLGAVAHRTSPTNIGLQLLSTLAAFDLGYLGLFDLAWRLRMPLDTMDLLEKHHGHLLNWYDTHTRLPLAPRYVSTVDSGNLRAMLIVVRQGCQDVLHSPIVRWDRLQGLVDTFGVLHDVLGELGCGDCRLAQHLDQVSETILDAKQDPDRWIALLQGLERDDAQRVDRLLLDLVQEQGGALGSAELQLLRIWIERARYQVQSALRGLNSVVPWRILFDQAPGFVTDASSQSAIGMAWLSLVESVDDKVTLIDLPRVGLEAQNRAARLLSLLRDLESQSDSVQEIRTWLGEAIAWAERLHSSIEASVESTWKLIDDLRAAAAKADAYIGDMDSAFLLDPVRMLFHIGYNVDAAQLDRNYYDLLASEARIASLVAIAAQDVPSKHWLHMARPITEVRGQRALVSWSGTAFEYLMPALIMREYPGTLLASSSEAVVTRQIEYANEKGVPWGISESGFYGFDAGRHYQYRAFGVPGLGFKRGLDEDLVITPYASVLAMGHRPHDVVRNIRRLVSDGMMGTFGLYEAADYTPRRLPPGERRAIVKSYMVHHQSMILVSLANYLSDRAIVRRFHSDPRIQSVDLLLQERIAEGAPLEQTVGGRLTPVPVREQQVTLNPWPVSLATPIPHVHTISNGQYGLLVTNLGGGYSWWGSTMLTRWRADASLDGGGTWIYLQDRDRDLEWSLCYQPVPGTGDREVIYGPSHAEFSCRDHDILATMEVVVAGDQTEIRRITLSNAGPDVRRLRVTTYAEVVLGEVEPDRRHPAFSKMFVESEYVAPLNGLLFWRRQRSAEDSPLFLFQRLVVEPGVTVSGAHEADRAKFIGRGQSLHQPAALQPQGDWLSGTTGTTLDPVSALGQDLELAPYTTVRLALVTTANKSRQSVLLEHYSSWPTIDRVVTELRSQGSSALRNLGFGPADLQNVQLLLSAMLYSSAGLRAVPEVLANNTLGQPGLWVFGISGDYPILLIQVKGDEDSELLRLTLKAHRYWRNCRIPIDLVIVSEEQSGYTQQVHRNIVRLVYQVSTDSWLNQRGGIFVLSADQMTEQEYALLQSVARVILDTERGSLADQVAPLVVPPVRLSAFSPIRKRESLPPTPSLQRPDGLLFDNGYGGFTPDGREYVVYLDREQWTPAPWINVVANPDLGFLVSEAGASYSWAVNSGENRLTSWSNDPVTDRPGEALYLRDEETAVTWSPTPLPARDGLPYLVRHGAGYSVFEHHSSGLEQRLQLFVVPDAPVKVVRLRLTNTWDWTRRLTATYYAEWVLGVSRDTTQYTVVTDFDEQSKALLARHPYSSAFGSRVAFLAASEPVHGVTVDRTEFFGERGDVRSPAALGRIGLEGKVRGAAIPCAAMQVHVNLEPGETKELWFLLGQGDSLASVREWVLRYQDGAQVDAAWQAVGDLWDDLLGTIQVETPDLATNVMLNRWLLYQALACRFWGRSAFYQSSGAYGFRDQLQDAMALAAIRPGWLREHLVRAAQHQFEAGDVLHWWHPPTGAGVRTRCSDDLLWLPYVTAHYIQATDDLSILDEQVPFLIADPLDEREHERYNQHWAMGSRASLYEHCCRALERGYTLGSHDLPLIGTGDWNDGLNRVGIEGRGESVWLAWFLYSTLQRFADVCDRAADSSRAAEYRQRASSVLEAVQKVAWNGQWYTRAYYDDGAPLGAPGNQECEIDAIAQSWSVLSGAPAYDSRPQRAMEAVRERLVRPEDQLVLLFTPPFNETPRDPGYIKGYPPGIRENGGQYTHAAVWTVWAFADLKDRESAFALARLMNPITHADTPEKAARYAVEPYVVAADVYSVPPYVGRGGWTWYTGSAAWMYRLGIEGLLGLTRKGNQLLIDPCVPRDWPAYTVTYRDYQDGAQYRIQVVNGGEGLEIQRILFDDKPLADHCIPLLGDGKAHTVVVWLG